MLSDIINSKSLGFTENKFEFVIFKEKLKAIMLIKAFQILMKLEVSVFNS